MAKTTAKESNPTRSLYDASPQPERKVNLSTTVIVSFVTMAIGVVVGINPGQSITIQEMNFGGPNGKLNVVYQSTIDWGRAVSFNYIHARR